MHFNIQDKYYQQIKKRLKTAEGRIDKSKFNNLKIGDIITFSPNDYKEFIYAEIIYLKDLKTLNKC